ncbi:hypothetical protein [Piscirickettsia salmonis]
MLSSVKAEWVIDEVNLAAAQKQRIVFSDIIGTQFQCYALRHLKCNTTLY